MSVLTDLIYGGSNAVAGLTEGAVNDAIAKYGADKEIAFPDTAYFFPTIYEKQKASPHLPLPEQDAHVQNISLPRPVRSSYLPLQSCACSCSKGRYLHYKIRPHPFPR